MKWKYEVLNCGENKRNEVLKEMDDKDWELVSASSYLNGMYIEFYLFFRKLIDGETLEEKPINDATNLLANMDERLIHYPICNLASCSAYREQLNNHCTIKADIKDCDTYFNHH